MRHRKPRRFRHRPNGRHHHQRNNGMEQTRLGSSSFSNTRNFKSQQSAEKLVERYNALAKEALSSGDKILSENYFQHADHFSRILSERENYKFSKDKDNNSQSTQVASKNPESTPKQEEIKEKDILKS